MLKGILFDLDDTLLDWSGFSLDWALFERQHLRGVFDYIRAELHPINDLDAFCVEFRSRMMAAWSAGSTTQRAPNLGTVLVETSVAFGVPAEQIDARQCLKAYHWGVIPGTRIFPEVPQTLKLIQQHGILTGIVTNADQPMWLRDIEMREHGIFDFFPNCRIAASDVGYLKPHPVIFQTALRTLGTLPEETVFVGDDPAADIVGAQAAGLKAVLRHLPQRPPGKIKPDATIRSLDQLPSILDKWYPGWR